MIYEDTENFYIIPLCTKIDRISLVDLVDLLRELGEDGPGAGVLLLDVAELLGVHHVEERSHLVTHQLHQRVLKWIKIRNHFHHNLSQNVQVVIT